MHKRFRKVKVMGLIAVATALTAVGFAPNAYAGHSGLFAQFDFCPSTAPGVTKCLHAVTNGGKVVLGKKTVPIVNPVTLQGGMEKPVEGSSPFVAATNGVTLQKVAQPVPGGLAGLVNCKEISNLILRGTCEFVFENGLTGVNSTLELARPASEIRVSQGNLANEEGVALKLPVKVHLENTLLGGECYIGSSASPIIFNLTTGATAPPAPNTSIHGVVGETAFLEEGEIVEITENVLVDNAWGTPGASGCGGALFESILNPIINASVGTPSAAGKNTAILENTVDVATAFSVNNH